MLSNALEKTADTNTESADYSRVFEKMIGHVAKTDLAIML